MAGANLTLLPIKSFLTLHQSIFTMNITLLIFFGIAAIALIVFLVVRNQKDEQKFEDQINNDYPKAKDTEVDVETDEKV